MSVPFKKIQRKNPRKPTETGKYYPQVVTAGKAATLSTVAYLMKDKSSLSHGDIKSVLTNFVEAMRFLLFNGKSVNVENFGVFSLSAHTLGTDKREECTSKNIRSLRINFRASSSVRPNLTSSKTRADGEGIDFYDVETYQAGPDDTDPGADDDEAIDPGA